MPSRLFRVDLHFDLHSFRFPLAPIFVSMKFSRTLVATTVLTGSEVEERPPEERRTNNAHGDSISRDCQFVPAITSLRFNATTCLARSTRNRTGDARTKRASSSNGWRLTNLTFHSAPLRGHQRRIARDRSLRSFAIVPLHPFFARAFSFSSPSFRVRPAHASPLLLALTTTTAPFALDSPLFDRDERYRLAALGQCLLRKNIFLILSLSYRTI